MAGLGVCNDIRAVLIPALLAAEVMSLGGVILTGVAGRAPLLLVGFGCAIAGSLFEGLRFVTRRRRAEAGNAEYRPRQGPGSGPFDRVVLWLVTMALIFTVSLVSFAALRLPALVVLALGLILTGLAFLAFQVWGVWRTPS